MVMWFVIGKSTIASYSWFVLLVALFGRGWTRGTANKTELSDANPFNHWSSKVTINPAFTRRRRALFCRAPRQPDNGKVRIRQDLCTSGNCEIPEGDEVGLGQWLTYSCNPGYRLEGISQIVYCIGNGEWSHTPRFVEIKCDALNSVTRFATCQRLGDNVNCDFPTLPQTRAEVICRPGYQRSSSSLSPRRLHLTCSEDGSWIPLDTLTCVPTCGRAVTHQTRYIVNGTAPKIGDFPWHATLYMLQNSEKKFICGATIIRTDLVLTAAHCVYDETYETVVNPEKIFVMTGNVFRNYDYAGHNNEVVRRGEVKTIYIRCDHFGLRGHYAWDIAILRLKTPFELSSTLLPACLADSEQLLEPGAYGKIAGFGRTATSSSSAILQSISVPYVSYRTCRGSTNGNQNKLFIQPDKFCAGYTNGSAVCEGDSGGGIVFEQNDKWYVMGIVSVGLGVNISNGERTCDTHSYTLYTKVQSHIEWIQQVIISVKYHQYHLPCSTDTQSTQTTTTTTTTTTPRPPNVVSISGEFELCNAPSQPQNGKWKLHRSLCNGLDGPDLDCEVPSGAELPLGSELVYVCDPGYEHSGETVLCLDEGDWSSSPVCVRG